MTDPTRIQDWVEETLRFDTSSQFIARTLTQDWEIHGRPAVGARLLLLLGSANRDPRVFGNPDRYDLDRDTSALISFGRRRYCLGANLARLEARIALTEFARRVARYDINEAAAERVHWISVRGFARLPVTTETRHA